MKYGINNEHYGQHSSVYFMLDPELLQKILGRPPSILTHLFHPNGTLIWFRNLFLLQEALYAFPRVSSLWAKFILSFPPLHVWSRLGHETRVWPMKFERKSTRRYLGKYSYDYNLLSLQSNISESKDQSSCSHLTTNWRTKSTQIGRAERWTESDPQNLGLQSHYLMNQIFLP